MKKLLLLLFLSIPSAFLFAQLNMTLKSQINYDENLNDVWGYASGDHEYALVGTRTGVSIVDVTDTETAVEVGFADGPTSTWRDIKVHKDYAYVTNEEGGGVLVINLANLPDNFSSDDYYYWSPVLPGNPNPLEPCHNIFIDENGIGYLIGCNLNNGGQIFIDVDTNPGMPEFIGFGSSVYSHDVYVRNDTLYSADIYEGNMSIHDVQDKLNPQLLATQNTPFSFTHNVWISDDGQFAYTTDEKADAPVAVYDISDLSDIKEVDQFRPLSTINQGVLPHNVFVWNQWLVISYYADGCILVDAQRPENLIEVGNFDTVLPGEGGGAWGVYPFLPSGTVLVSDIGNGLYVLEPDYVEACFLEGKITDSSNGASINNAFVEIMDSPQVAFTNANTLGDYKTGQAISGVFPVKYSAPGYYPQTIEVTLENGELTLLDVQLDPVPTTVLSISIVDAVTGAPLNNVPVILRSSNFEFNESSNAAGNLLIPTIPFDDYSIIVGKWGYQTRVVPYTLSGPGNTTIELEQGYQDDFVLDFDWTVSGNAISGIWERGIPNGTFLPDGTAVNPGNDVDDDIGEYAYVTGNFDGTFFDDEVSGLTRLTSPTMDLTIYSSPVIHYRTWFYDDFGNGPPNDFMEVKISNGMTEVTLDFVNQTSAVWQSESSFNVADFIDITNNMQIIFEVEDQPTQHVLEAGVDKFYVSDADALAPFTANITSGCIPLEVNFEDPNDNTTAWEWTFEGGSPSTSNQKNPTITYFQSGTFNVSLNVTSNGGATTQTQLDFITIDPLPMASLDYTVVNDSTVVFSTDAASDTNVTWNFGDGTTSNETNPTHVYTNGGIINVTLFVFNDCGGFQTSEEILINLPTSAENLTKDQIILLANPNPFVGDIDIVYDLDYLPENTQLNIFNVIGQLQSQTLIEQKNGNVRLGNNLSSGLYFLQLEANGKTVQTLKILKR